MGNKKLFGILLAVALLISAINPANTPTEAAAKVKLNKTSITLSTGKTVTLKVKGTKKKATWTSANKKIATVTQKGKVTAKSAGTTKITAKIAKKKYSCTVKVTDSGTAIPTPVPTATPTQEPEEPTAAPTQEPATEPTQKPTEAEVSDNFEKLKAYIMDRGSTNASGYQSYAYTYLDAMYGIDYMEVEGMPVFSFQSVYEDNDSVLWGVSFLNLTPSLPTVTFNSMLCMQADSSYRYDVSASIDPKTFTKGTTLDFEVTNNTIGFDNSTIQTFENTWMGNAFYAWEVFLDKQLGLSWADLGLTAY